MAKKSKIMKAQRQAATVAKYAAQRAELKRNHDYAALAALPRAWRPQGELVAITILMIVPSPPLSGGDFLCRGWLPKLPTPNFPHATSSFAYTIIPPLTAVSA